MLIKSMYSTVKAAFYVTSLFAVKLLSNRFKLNPYDLCVAYIKMDGLQCT